MAFGQGGGNEVVRLTTKGVSEWFDRLAAGPVKEVITALDLGPGNEVDKLTKGVSEWFDRSLTVLGESYKRTMQGISLVVGLVVAVSLNIDTLTVIDRLYRDKELRDQAVAVAEEFVKNTNATLITKCAKLPLDKMDTAEECQPVAKVIEIGTKRSQALNLPIGWGNQDRFWEKLLSHSFVGWVLTALAVSLGAPFWFDLLNNLINVRHGISRPPVDGQAGTSKA